MSVPRATMRLQFHKGFTFADAERLVPYFSALGISHVYASPILTARPGSPHGYDVIDPTRVNLELGGEDGLRRLVTALRAASLGLIVDIVPNHMSVAPGNAWWWDVLENGTASRYAHFFDIDWQTDEPSLRGKVLVPSLGTPYRDALSAGEITLVSDPHRGFIIRYFDHVFPVAKRHWSEIDSRGLAAFEPSNADGRQSLDHLLDQQNYRLAFWRVANDEINWRRFFDVNELVALRMEDDEVFEATHAAVLRLYAEGLIDGFRIDHIDGLSYPGDYCRKLRSRLTMLEPSRPTHLQFGRAYLVVEKILGPDEYLSVDWDCAGTTGYGFMDQVGALLHQGGAEHALTALWASISGRSPSFSSEARASRYEILERSLAAELGATARAFHRLARTAASDVTLFALRRALGHILAHFPVYRVYSRPGHRSNQDLRYLRQAIDGAMAACLPSDRRVVSFLGTWLSGEGVCAGAIDLQARALTEFHQLSTPLAAKAVEDTALYRYGRLLSRNDVGFDPAQFALTPAQFHARMEERQQLYPHAMLATATHDHKRGEDVIARLAAVSEIADEWSQALTRWLDAVRPLRRCVDGLLAPTTGDLAMLFQTIVGTWPALLNIRDVEGRVAYADRLARWQQKALRESKLVTDWSSPNEPYEAAARRVLMQIITDEEQVELITDIRRFVDRIGPAAAANGLAQTLLKLTAPGVPDIYQGTEYWDLSLVDPDNRRPVDFEARARSLSSTSIDRLATHWRDGRVKQAVIARALALRKALPRLFADGSYLPISVKGSLAEHVVAFARHHDASMIMTVVARLPMRLLTQGESLSIPDWKDTSLDLPAMCRDRRFYDCMREGRLTAHVAPSKLAQILDRLPVALFVSNDVSIADG